MAQEIQIGNDLYDLLNTRNFDVDITDERGQAADPADGKVFKFDWVSSNGNNYGTAVIVAGDENELMLFYGDNLGKGMAPEDKDEWFGFMKELKDFSTRHNFNTFSPKNINALKHTMTGMAAIKEGLFEGYYGNRRTSYSGEPTEARLVINHNRMLGENDKRYRYVESLFIETADRERFKLAFTNLAGGRAMLEHVRQGGKPYDIRGSHINEMVTEMKVLSRFNRASQGRVVEGVTQEITEQAHTYYQSLRESMKRMGTPRGYAHYFESWHPAEIGEQEELVENIKTMFIEQTLDTRIEEALPLLARIQQQGNAMKEADIFESWINTLSEGTWNLPETPEQLQKLKEMMSKELVVGPDATNATEQLYDLVGDDELFDRLGELAERDPRANAWNDTKVMARLQELGIDTTGQEPAGVEPDGTEPGIQPEQPVAPTQDMPQEPPMAPISEADDIATFESINAMRKAAGLPVVESRNAEGSEYIDELVGKVLALEKPGMSTDRDNDDFYKAVYDELIEIGMTPKAARYKINYDEDFISDVASAYHHFTSHPEVKEGAAVDAYMAGKSPALAHFADQLDKSHEVKEGSCNMTTEGEYCPEHGLMECGSMYEMGTVAGSMAPVMGEGNDDPINSNSAITGAYYESKSDDALLARIKSLALIK